MNNASLTFKRAQPVYQCEKVIAVKERDFPQPYYFRCLKHNGHSGDHYALDPEFHWVYWRRDGVQLRLEGKAEFLWREREVEIRKNGLTVVEAGEKREAMLTIWEYGERQEAVLQ